MTITIRTDDIVEYPPDTGRRKAPQPRRLLRQISIKYFPDDGSPETRQSGGIRLCGMTDDEANTATLEAIIAMLREKWQEAGGNV